MCNGDWEHTYGIHLETLDNPGWHIRIELTDTELQERPFQTIQYGIGPASEPDAADWLICRKEGLEFHGYGGPDKLDVLFGHFLDWAESR